MSVRVDVPAAVGGFAEDKDEARKVRLDSILPALSAGESVVLDFSGVSIATQSFIHALFGEAIKKFGEDVLDKLEFRNCSPQLKSVIELVVDYSLGGFDVQHEMSPPTAKSRRRGKAAA